MLLDCGSHGGLRHVELLGGAPYAGGEMVVSVFLDIIHDVVNFNGPASIPGAPEKAFGLVGKPLNVVEHVPVEGQGPCHIGVLTRVELHDHLYSLALLFLLWCYCVT